MQLEITTWLSTGQAVARNPALTDLFVLTYERRRDRFCPLVVTIVRHGLSYRGRIGSPVQRKEVESINKTLQRLSFKIPELWDRGFLDSLPERASPPASDPGPLEESPAITPRSSMPALHDRFMDLHAQPDRALAGRRFEQLLVDLLAAWNLAPRSNFRVTGEEIDGSFLLDGATYLVEAKWTGSRIEAAPLYVFRQKVASKSAYTRGLFVAVEGFTRSAISALGTGQEHRIVLLDGTHLLPVLMGTIDFGELLKVAVRHLEQFGEPLLPRDRLAELA